MKSKTIRVVLSALLLVASAAADRSAPALRSRRAAAPPLGSPAPAPPTTLLAAAPRPALRPKAKAGPLAAKAAAKAGPSIGWAVLHAWLYMFSIALSAGTLPVVIRTVVNADGSAAVTPAAVWLSGKVEAVDKTLTFLFVGFLCALSDIVGRRALLLWASLGFGCTCALQATALSESRFFLADVIDGLSSCMLPVCQAYVTDVSAPGRAVFNLGLFQGIAIGGAFIIGGPLGGILGKILGPRKVLLLAAGLQALNALLVVAATPESLPAAKRAGRKLDLRQANPLGALRLLFGRAPLLRGIALAYALVTLSRTVLDGQFFNYVQYRFGWGPAQAAPILVMTGLMLAVAPRVVVPRIGLRRSILYGTLVLALGQVATAFAAVPPAFPAAIFVTSVGCACIPALVGLLASAGGAGQTGALLGGLQSVSELCGAVSNTVFPALFAYFISDAAPVHLPGAHFLAAAAFALGAYAVAARTFKVHAAEVQTHFDHAAASSAM